MFFEVEGHSFHKSHFRFILRWIAFHELVNFDTLKGTDLFDMGFESREATTHSNHNLVGLDHEDRSQRANQVLALVRLRSLFDLYNRQERQKCYLELRFAHRTQEFILVDFCLFWLGTRPLSLFIKERLLC